MDAWMLNFVVTPGRALAILLKVKEISFYLLADMHACV